jgi:hypothetical protein
VRFLLILAQLLDTGIQIHGLDAGGIVQIRGGVFDRPSWAGIHAVGAFGASILDGHTSRQSQICEHSDQADPGPELRSDKKEGFALPSQPGMQGYGFV